MNGTTSIQRIQLLSRFSLLILFLCISLVRGLFYSVVIPPWQAPDEPRHLEYAIRLAEKRWLLTKEDVSLELQREILLSMKESNFWRHLGREEPEVMPESFLEDSFLRRSGPQLGDESPLYYLVPALVFTLTSTQDLLLQLYIMRWFSVILSSATVLVSCLIAGELFSRDRFMIIAIPAFITFLPMFTFIGASANNDSLAVLIASLLIWQLARVLRRGLSWRSGLVICALTILSVLAKKTTLFTVPLVAVAIPIYLWGRHVVIRDSYRAVSGVSCMLATLFLGLILTWRGGDAAGWVEQPEPWMDTRSDSVARSGGYSLHVLDDTPQLSRRVMQSLPFNSVRELRGKTVNLSVWVRSAKGNQRGCFLVGDSEGRDLSVFSATETWNRQILSRTVSSQATSIRVVLSPGDCEREGVGDLYFDDVTLVESGAEGSNLLHNGSGEVAALRVRPLLDRFARYVPLGQFLDARSYDLSSLNRYGLYVLLTFAGFWANFGWLTLPLDIAWYALLALITLTAVVGLGLLGAKTYRERAQGTNAALPWRDKSLLLLLLSASLALIQILLPMVGRNWQPQGRYLFPAIIPLAILFVLGLREVIPLRWRRFVLPTYVMGLLLFDLLCLGYYIIPAYYG